MSDEDTNLRDVPGSDLELQYIRIKPEWSTTDKNKQPLKDKMTKLVIVKDKDGKQIFDEDRNPIVKELSEYDNLAFITKDFRFGNLGKYNNEKEYCIHYAKLAHDLLQMGYMKSHSAAMARVAVQLEISQSSDGFFTKQMNTFRQETTTTNIEPPKKSLFGGSKKGEMK